MPQTVFFRSAALLLACAGRATAAHAAVSAPPPPEEFFQRPAIVSPRVSPDAAHLVFGRVDGEKIAVQLIDLKDGKTTLLARIDNLSLCFWKGNDRIVLANSGTAVAVITLSKGTMEGLTKIAKAIEPLASLSETLPMSPDTVIVKDRLPESESRINLVTGESERLFIASGPDKDGSSGGYLVDTMDVVRVRTRFDAAGAELQIRSRNDVPFSTIAHWKAGLPPWTPLGFSEDGNSLWVITREDADLGALHLYDLNTHQLGPRLPPLPGAEGMLLDGIFSGDGRRLVGLRYLSHAGKDYWLDEPRRRLVEKLTASFPGETVRIVSSSADEQVHVISVASPQDAGGRMIDDVNDAATWAIKAGYACPGRICLWGEGLAAGLGAVAAAEQPDYYQALIDIDGLTDWSNIGQDRLGELTISPNQLKTRSPEAAAKKLRMPILALHTDFRPKDEPFQAACQKAGVRFFLGPIVPAETSPSFDEFRAAHFARQSELFLEKYTTAGRP